MGFVYADIELVNQGDLEMARRNLLDPDEVRSIKVYAQVDNGCISMAINENIQSVLNLPFVERKTFFFANEEPQVYDVVGPLEVRYANRRSICTALVFPGNTRPLLGAIPMEDMGVIISPARQELIVHPDPYFSIGILKPEKG